nr:mucin-5AC-like isoform X2 [Nomia melanderi]
MVRRFSWCTVVALVVLLFVTTEGLRERSTQVDDYKTPNVRDRGALRFNSKSPEEASTSLPFSRSKSPRDKATQSKKFTERRDEGTNHSNTETKFESSKRSNFRTTKTSERNISTAGEITNSSRRSPLGKNIDEIKKGEPTINRRNGKRYSSDSNDGTRPNDDRNVLSNPPVELSRKTFTRTFSTYEVTERLDGNEPSVFTATTESSRSRTGRKIQTTFTSRDFKTQIPTSRRYSNRNSEGADPTTVSLKRSGGRRSTTERIERGTRSGRSKVSNRESNAISRKNQDTVLSESESVRVDIPLTVESTENPSTDVTTPVGAFSQRQSVTEFSRRSDTKESLRVNSRRGSERSKGQGRFNNSDSNSTGRSSRRGSSKFNDNATTETSEQTVSWKKNAISRERSRVAEGKKAAASEPRSRLRNRNFENSVNSASTVSEQEVKRKSSGDRNLGERRSRVPESTARSVEGRGQDQDTRRGRSRRLNATTPVASVDVTSTIAPETSVVTEVLTTSTDAEILTSTDRSTASTTVTSRTLTTTARPSSTTSASEGRNRGRGRGGNQGRAQLKEDFFNHGLGFRGRKPSTEGPTAAGDSKKPGSSKNDSHYGNPGWTLRRRPGYSNNSESPPKTALPSPREQTNEVIPSNEQSTSTEVVSTVESSTRRSFKKPQASTEESTTVSAATTKSSRRGNKSFGLSKASTESEESDNYPPEFKARLSQLKVTNTKTSAPKSTSRSPSEVKKSSTALFAERSKLKLDLARSKPKPTGKPVPDEATKVAKFTKLDRRASTGSSQEDEKAPKLYRPRKSSEGPSKVTARPSNSKKGRIISERMVTSISVEERVEETTRSYQPTNPTVTVSSEEVPSATTLDTTRIRFSSRGGKKSKEDTSNARKNSKVPAIESNDTITTFKPKKVYAYQSRNRKTQDQPSDLTSATIAPKKSTTRGAKQSSRQKFAEESKEEIAPKKAKFVESVTKPTFRPRYSKRTKERSSEEKAEYQAISTTKLPAATSRYSKKKAAVKTVDKVRAISTESPATQTKKIEFRPRTATYRRHSDVPTTVIQTTTKVDGAGVAITPRSPQSLASLNTTTPSTPSVSQEPQVNLMIANDTAQQTTGITGSSNGDSGNTNVFNPTRSAFIIGNGTLLEQLRSTVAPLLSSLGNKTPVFSAAYSNVNTANSSPRITPNGSPPRFSARYKGAELFVRKPSNVYQPTVPSITSSSTTPVTPVESNTPLNTQMGTTSSAMSASGGRLTPIVSTGRPPTDSQGGRIVQDRERDEATRTKEAGGQRSSVYIGQDKFVNYWTDGAGNTNPRVVSVNINSVAGGVNEGPSSSIVSFDNLLNSGQNGPVTAPPGFPWRDPLDQIFGITTSSPVITASVASNTLDDLADSNGPASPVNPFVEIFTPFSSTMNRANQMSSTQAPASPPTTAMSPQTTTTTTSAPMTTTTTTTMAPTTTTTTTMAPTTTTTTTTTSTTTTTTTTTPAPTTTMQPSSSPPATTASPVTPNQNLASNLLNLQNNLSPNVQQQNAFGTTFDDLAFLNSLLQDKSKDTSPKTLTQVEQLLANKILSLALNGQGPSPTRAPKAINVQNASPNLILPSTRSPSEPIIIDLLPSSTAGPPTWRPVPTPQQQILNEAPINGNSLPGQATKKQISTTTAKSNKLSSTTARTSLISTTKGPVSNTAKPPTIPRPKTTTQAPLGLGASLWQALFGGGLFGPSTTARPVKPKPVKTTPKSINITPKPIPTTQKPETTQVTPSTTTFRTVDISKIGVGTPNSIVKEAKSVTTPRSISTAKSSLANNPKPKVSKTEASTFSPEDDAKFLVALLRAVQDENKAVPGKKSSGTKEDDESFLRAILSGRALTTTTPAPLNEINNAALLAALLKAQGIEPPTPANNIREQLLLASIGQSVTSAPAASPTTASTTITTVPTSAATRPTDKTVTPGPTSRPRIRTTTWTPSSTYPPPLFSSFSNYGTPVQSAGGDNSGSGALFGATRAFSQFLGAAISGAAQQLQSLVRNGTKIVSDVVG